MEKTIDFYSVKKASKKMSWARDFLLISIGSILISLFAKISLPLPFTPIPLAFQPHVCLLLGALMGSKRGALSVLFYLLQGVLGLPVFALGGAGLPILLGPRGGYLLGYVIATFLVGYLFERGKEKTALKTFSILSLGNAVIYLFGVAHLSIFIGFAKAVILGVLPFLLGDLLKLGLVSRVVTGHGRLFSKLPFLQK